MLHTVPLSPGTPPLHILCLLTSPAWTSGVGVSSKSCSSVSDCQCFARTFLFCSHLAKGLTILSSSSSTCAPPLQTVGCLILCSKPALPFPHPSSVCMQPTLSLILGGPTLFFLTISGQQFTDPPTVVRVHCASCLGLLYMSVMVFFLYCCLNSSSSVLPAWMPSPSLQSVFPEP